LQAGIPGSQLMLALEPEAASIFCKHIPSERMVIGGKSCLDAFSPKTKYLKFEDTKGVIGIRISKKNRQHNGQKKKYKRTNNDLQNIHIKLKIE
jgi:hypothetical protein